ncbi:acyl-CoA dehydrogenase family protein [Pseudooceanicola sp. CBS1P-1]|uniref:Acyl-CoA dehydrogenase n=1 Tax=Pseudooceanicola albus TaxID=2692189 RepID=A0A6L7G5P2_9RHOB|nr:MULTISPECIES: acyl-CoA dehydrogenase family protein [Pseudooceanicola]MBT9385047.1 acyl-CoA dehydrogenase family protein [Pseudooceanicola endophyticus]MXN18660.1 acyl-CoA dehydrogenase [Pseudooceanicola albus]
MIPFQAPVDEIYRSFALFAGDLPDWDAEFSAEIAGHFAAFAEGVLAPLNTPGDRQGCRLDAGRVKMPDGFAAAYVELAESGWQGLTAPEAFGGQALDHLTAAAVSEIFSGANHSLQMVTGLVPGAISTLLAHGTPAQQEAYIPRLTSGEWLSTMCLTEAGAGSDLSTIRCRAVATATGWAITGQKIFISGGDQDMSEGILHLVLARTGTAEEGVRGLSLFLCRSDTGTGRNAITVTRIEEKLGLHASPTCQVEFDGAEAELIGTEGRGLAAMFTMMNHARLDVALQGVAHATRAHAIASAYAGERRQGRLPDGSPAVLADHPDVQRMLEEQRISAQVSRAMVHIALGELERGDRPALIEFLTPLCKLYATEAGIRAADLGIQVLGGYGYLEEYGLAQVWRDARITAIYEGANGIHALTLATRGLKLEGGAAIGQFAALVTTLSDGSVDPTDWMAQATALAAKADVRAVAHAFAQETAALLAAAIGHRLAA